MAYAPPTFLQVGWGVVECHLGFACTSPSFWIDGLRWQWRRQLPAVCQHGVQS
jgi:hypothetical protein